MDHGVTRPIEGEIFQVEKVSIPCVHDYVSLGSFAFNEWSHNDDAQKIKDIMSMSSNPSGDLDDDD